MLNPNQNWVYPMGKMEKKRQRQERKEKRGGWGEGWRKGMPHGSQVLCGF